jgi:tetratricopeptide (TPR) repeat protein
MKICPQCASEFADDKKFCSHDATPLVSKAVPLTPQNMPDEATRVRVNVPLSPPVFNPPPIVEEAAIIGSPVVATNSEAKKNTRMIVGALIAAMLIVSVAGWFIYQKYQGSATTQQIEAALAQDDPFLPTNNLAQFYDAYLQANPSKEDLEATNKKIKAKLSKIGDDSFRSLSDDADPKVEWNTIAQSYQLLSKINPNDKEAQARAVFAQGKVSLNAKKYAEAADNFNKANRVKNNWDLALNSLGQTYKAQGKISDAFIAFEQATKTNPDFVWGWHNLFQIYRDQKKYDDAKNAISKAIELKPDRPSFMKALAGVQEAQGQIPEAITTYEKYIVLESNAEEKIKTQKYINDLKQKPSTALVGQPTSNEFDGLSLTDIRGQIDIRSIHFNLAVNGGKAAGFYVYDAGSSKLTLTGIVTPEGKIKLVEKTPAGKETGKFEISRMLQEGKQIFYGEWQDAKGAKKLSFSLEPQ